jgi:hypothetical protein
MSTMITQMAAGNLRPAGRARRRWFLGLVAASLLLGVAAPAFAQDEAPAPSPAAAAKLRHRAVANACAYELSIYCPTSHDPSDYLDLPLGCRSAIKAELTANGSRS